MAQGNLDTSVVAATPEGVRQAIDAFARFSEIHAVPDDLRRRFQLALDEVLSNVVRHGRPGDVGEIRLAFRCEPGTLTAEVEDMAEPFNPLDQPRPDTGLPLEQRRPGGLGIALVRSLIDDVRYERTEGRNRLTMVSRLAAQPGCRP